MSGSLGEGETLWEHEPQARWKHGEHDLLSISFRKHRDTQAH